jgi:hypothetical protein
VPTGGTSRYQGDIMLLTGGWVVATRGLQE